MMHAIVPKIEPATAPPQLAASAVIDAELSIFGLDQLLQTIHLLLPTSSTKGSEMHSMRAEKSTQYTRKDDT